MLRVGLTGGIACGKSTIAQMFARRGARVASADDIARRLMQPGTPVFEEVVRHFGRGILDESGAIHRARLAQAAFSEGSSRVAELNRIVHPAVVAEQDEWMSELGRRDPGAVAIVEAALIYEAGADSHFDKIIVVTCRPEQKVERFAQRLGMDPGAARAEVERRSRAQIPDEQKAARADFVIDNSGREDDADRQVERVWAELQRKAIERHPR